MLCLSCIQLLFFVRTFKTLFCFTLQTTCSCSQTGDGYPRNTVVWHSCMHACMCAMWWQWPIWELPISWLLIMTFPSRINFNVCDYKLKDMRPNVFQHVVCMREFLHMSNYVSWMCPFCRYLQCGISTLSHILNHKERFCSQIFSQITDLPSILHPNLRGQYAICSSFFYFWGYNCLCCVHDCTSP